MNKALHDKARDLWHGDSRMVQRFGNIFSFMDHVREHGLPTENAGAAQSADAQRLQTIRKVCPDAELALEHFEAGKSWQEAAAAYQQKAGAEKQQLLSELRSRRRTAQPRAGILGIDPGLQEFSDHADSTARSGRDAQGLEEFGSDAAGRQAEEAYRNAMDAGRITIVGAGAPGRTARRFIGLTAAN